MPPTRPPAWRICPPDNATGNSDRGLVGNSGPGREGLGSQRVLSAPWSPGEPSFPGALPFSTGLLPDPQLGPHHVDSEPSRLWAEQTSPSRVHSLSRAFYCSEAKLTHRNLHFLFWILISKSILFPLLSTASTALGHYISDALQSQNAGTSEIILIF